MRRLARCVIKPMKQNMINRRQRASKLLCFKITQIQNPLRGVAEQGVTARRQPVGIRISRAMKTGNSRAFWCELQDALGVKIALAAAPHEVDVKQRLLSAELLSSGKTLSHVRLPDGEEVFVKSNQVAVWE
jgi:hypothetical protein